MPRFPVEILKCDLCGSQWDFMIIEETPTSITARMLKAKPELGMCADPNLEIWTKLLQFAHLPERLACPTCSSRVQDITITKPSE